MIVTGLFLWGPSNTRGLGGVLYPRFGLRGRPFWKDVHSVVGIYVSALALFLLFTGLPWAKSWGGYLKVIRHLSAGRAVSQDWVTSSSQVAAARQARSSMAMQDMPGMRNQPKPAQHAVFGRHSTLLTGPDAFLAIDRMVATVAP